MFYMGLGRGYGDSYINTNGEVNNMVVIHDTFDSMSALNRIINSNIDFSKIKLNRNTDTSDRFARAELARPIASDRYASVKDITFDTSSRRLNVSLKDY